ncbi:MAG: dihydrofolate reductase family protein [Bacteroidetes bacterium]|nr:dihydrofolate reductase family protein [Bacteroidota bacterium]
MRKLKLQMQMTIDGFVAGPNNEQDWVFASGKQDPEALQQIVNFSVDLVSGCDTLLVGRKLSQGGFVDYWANVGENQPDNPWNPFGKLMISHRKIVFSRTGAEISGPNVEVESRDLATAVKELKNQPGKDMLVYGGVEFVRSLVSENLIDEYYLIVNPIAIGSGLSIFEDRKLLELESSTAFKHGKIVNKYVPV